jgi:hypothetical protein
MGHEQQIRRKAGVGMASEDWNIDLPAQKISHKSLNFSIQFDGDPTSNDCEGKPSRFPDELSALQKVRLLREAYDAYIEAYESVKPQKQAFGYNAKPAGSPSSTPAATKPAPKSEPAAGPASNKPTLSLKRAGKPVSS